MMFTYNGTIEMKFRKAAVNRKNGESMKNGYSLEGNVEEMNLICKKIGKKMFQRMYNTARLNLNKHFKVTKELARALRIITALSEKRYSAEKRSNIPLPVKDDIQDTFIDPLFVKEKLTEVFNHNELILKLYIEETIPVAKKALKLFDNYVDGK